MTHTHKKNNKKTAASKKLLIIYLKKKKNTESLGTDKKGVKFSSKLFVIQWAETADFITEQKSQCM